MTDASEHKPKPGSKVILTKLPPGLIDGLPARDQEAIAGAVGRTILLVEYDIYGRAELEFRDQEGVIHFIYVSPVFIKAV
jgi:hypothetical protein